MEFGDDFGEFNDDEEDLSKSNSEEATRTDVV